jgi:hypothetical protein
MPGDLPVQFPTVVVNLRPQRRSARLLRADEVIE